MKMLKQTMKRIATLGLTAVLLVNTVPLDAFAADPAGAGGDVSIEAEVAGAGGDVSIEAEASYPAFVQSETIDGVKITVGAEEGVFPEGAVLSAEKVSKTREEEALEAVEEERPGEQNVAASYTYDIKVLDKDGNEVQPADESRVKLSFNLDEVADSNLETNIYHIRETDPDGTASGEKAGDDRNYSEETTESNDTASSSEESDNKELIAEKLEVETEGDTATAETDGFSLYTVEFSYNDLQYVMPGDSEIALSEILNIVGLTGEVTELAVSDSSLFSAEKNDSGEWFVTAHQTFSTEEWMRVTINDVVYEITVTDDNPTAGLQEDNEIDAGTAGHYFINMPKTGTETLKITKQDITGGKGTFKVYDDGGKNGNYSDNCNGYLVIETPAGYALKMSGSILSEGWMNNSRYDTLSIYSGMGTDRVVIADKLCRDKDGNSTPISPFITPHGSVTLYFKSDSGTNTNFSGIDLTVECLDNTDHKYDALEWLVIDGTKEHTDDGYYFVNMPTNGSVEYNMSDDFDKSFQVRYDHDNSRETGTITLNAPDGRNMIYSGTWDGSNSDADCNCSISEGNTNKYNSSKGKIFTATTTAGNNLTITCSHNGSSGKLALNVKLKPEVVRITDMQEFYAYTGSEINISPTITDFTTSATLNKGTDYDITFSPETVKDKGVYTASINGKGSYDFEKTFNFYVGTTEYVDADGMTKTKELSGLTLINSRNELPVSLSGWYLVTDNITFSSAVPVDGTANLILADGVTMNANRIRVNSGNTLNIYGQSDGTGDLIVSPIGIQAHDAGIGASENNDCGTITINSGNINAKGFYISAGIGAAEGHSCGSITINGGTVTAEGKNGYFDIGSSSGAVVINGGKVTAGTNGIGAANISLGWRVVEHDFIQSAAYSGTVSFQTGKMFIISGKDTPATTSNIAGEKIVPPNNVDPHKMVYSVISGIEDYYVPNESGIALSYVVKDFDGTTLTKGTDYTEAFSDSSGNPVEKITSGGIYTLTVTGKGTYSGTNTATIKVAGYKETLGEYEFTTGADSEGLYYKVDSESALRGLAKHVNDGGATAGKRFVQTVDITLTKSFTPIGTRDSTIDADSYRFQGIFDGGGKTTSGLSVNGNYYNAGLFGRIANATIKNVILINPNIISTRGMSDVSALVGCIAESVCTIDHCIIINPSLNITGNDYPQYIGVFVGEWLGATNISNCYYYDGNAEHNYAKYYADGHVDGIQQQSTATNVERVYSVTATGCTAAATATVSVGGTDYYKQGTALTVNASVPETGMKKFTATGATASLTNTLGKYTITLPASDVTVNYAEFTPTISVIDAQTYTGSAITPEVTVKDGDTPLTKGTDYTVSYSNNTNAAAYDAANPPTVTITGKGIYLGTASQTFTINKKSITPVVSITGWTYGDTPNSPSLTAESNPGGGTVKYQYRLNANGAGAFSDVVPTNASHVAYTVQATIAETANYKGGTATATFKIEKKPVTITGFSVSDKIYNGTTDAAVTGMAVINGLVGNDDITVTAGTAAFADKNVGTDKTVTFSGFYLSGESINNYTLSAQPTSVTADITPKPVTITGLTVTDKTYDGTTDATVDCSEAIFAGKVEGDSLSVSGVTGIFADKNAASGKTVTLNYGNAVLGGTDADNYIIAESGNQSEAAAAITKKTASAVSEISRTYLYTAGGQGSIDIAALLPADCGTNTYTVTKSGSVTYSADPAVADGILTYTVAPGTKDTTGTITVKAETLNYTDITITVNVKLTDKKPVELKDGTSVVLNKSTLTYGEALSALTFKTDTAVFVEQGNTSNVIAGSLSWKTAAVVPAAGTTSATWVFTPADAAYAAFEGTVAITVNKATPLVMTEPTVSAITYGQTLADSTLAEGIVMVGESPIEGSFAWKTGTVKPSVADSGETLYDVVFTPNDTMNYETAECKVTLIVNKADIPSDKITPPTANSLTYTGSAQELINPGVVSDGLGTMKYAFAKVSDTDNLPAAPTEEVAYNSSVPTAIKGGNYCVWYMVKGDANHKDKTPASVKVTISKEHSKSEEMKTIEVQTGSNVPVSVNLKAYLGENAIVSPSEITTENRTGTLRFSDVEMGSDKYTLSFKVTSETGGSGRIILKAQTENHQMYWLTIPVEAKAMTTEVKLKEAPGVDSAVEGVEVSGLDAYTDEQSGTTVKVEMNVTTESESSVDTAVVGKITETVAQVFSGVEGESIKKEYLDISVTKSVNSGSAQAVDDVGRVLELAIQYDLSGKFNPVVIREHNRTVRAFAPLRSKPGSNYTDGTFYVDTAKGTIYIYSEFFSTYSIAYATTDSYTVSFDAQGGSGANALVVKAGGTIPEASIPTSTKSGYSFEGWYTGTDAGAKLTAETVIDHDVTYYAHWKQNSSGGGGGGTPTPASFTVRFELGGHGTAIVPQTVEKDKTATRPADPEAEDFVFTGWYTSSACLESELFDFATPITKNITLYAGWREAKKFSVSFNMNGKEATDVPEAQRVEDGKCATEPAVSPKAEGFKFAGWYAEAECENLFDFNDPIKADTIIYAKWIDEKAESFTVTFDLNGKPGTAPSAQTVEKDKTATEPGIPKTEGFTFTGWYKEKECRTKYDFATPVTADITLYAGWESGEPIIIETGSDWNLYEDASVHEFKIRGINVNGTVANSNAKSKAYYDANISGSTITVKVTGDRKKAASNAALEFDLGNAGVVEYVLPVSYVKPSFKLSSTTATIKNGTETVLKTTILTKNSDGIFEPYDMTDVKVSGTGLGTVTKAADGSIEIKTNAASKGKISIVKDAWDGAKPVSLAYTVKSSKKDVLSVDLQGLKTVVVNSNAKKQVFSFDVTFNGAVPAEGVVKIVDKKNTGLATIGKDGKLIVAFNDGVKNGTYTITLQAGEAKTNVKVKVSDKALDKAVTAKVQTKYDVVTRQGMVVIPVLKDVSGTIEAVSVAESGFFANLDAAGNIVIDYTGNKYNLKNLNIGTLTLSLKLNGIDEPVKLTLNNVKAKKTTPTIKAGTVTIPKDAETVEGKVIGTVNIVSTYKVSSGTYKTISPVKTEIVGTPKDVTAKPNESDMTEIDIYSISKKNVSFKVKLTYAGGVTKTVTVKVNKK